MNTVDQRILIPASPDVVWEYLSNLENNPQWQANCRAVTFVSSTRRGQGTRWRHTNNRGRDVLIEVTAWYERAGYAYRIVDGSPYSHNSGSIRLQEIAEGTIVQWTFEYEISGLFSGFRNAVSVRRGVENDIIESLENLWRQANKLKRDDSFTAKSLMREAPDVESRASYQPRHPSRMRERMDEVIESDTDISLQAVQDANPDPETQPAPPISSEPKVKTSTLEQITPLGSPEPEPDFLSEIDKPREMPPVQVETPAEDDDSDRWMRPAEFVDENAPATAPVASEPEETQPYALEPLPDDTDSSTLSVFDLFGLPKPSETQQMRAVTSEETTPPPAPTTSAPTPPRNKPVSVAVEDPQPQPTEKPQQSGGRIGMRIIMRRRLIKIKRP